MSVGEHTTNLISAWPADYTICVQGYLDPSWSEWLGSMQVRHTSTGDSLLKGRLTDPAALHSLLNRIFDLNLLLLQVQRIENQEQ
ncbi:MAG TPA: hypothetical protein VLA49_09950 [Anaerolineales bacterium]|nr:hypothetical protein [Anaerolineales bacterium]